MRITYKKVGLLLGAIGIFGDIVLKMLDITIGFILLIIGCLIFVFSNKIREIKVNKL